MPPVPIVKQTEVRKALERAGCRFVRQRGSHVTMDCNGESVTVPVHKGRDMAPGTLRNVLDQAGMSVEEFVGWLKS